MATWWWTILYNIVRLASILLWASGRQCKWFSMSVILDVLLYFPVTQRAALLCTISTQWAWVLVWGFHTQLEYSTIGLTSDIYALVFSSSRLMLRFRLTKPSLLLAFAIVLSMCSSHVKSWDRFMPRYLTCLTSSRVCWWSWYLKIIGLVFLENLMTLHFCGCMEFHRPVMFPFFKLTEIVLEVLSICITSNR